MMKQFFIIFLFLGSLSSTFAKNYYSLYGIRIDQSLKHTQAELGDPSKVHSFEDGYQAFFFKKDGHILVLETEPFQPDRIWSIQIEGANVPVERGLNGVIPGDTRAKVIEVFGPPEKERKATNSLDNKEIPGTSLMTYYENGNFSFEIKNDKVSSIKIVLRLEKDPKELPDPMDFISVLKTKNESEMIRLMAGDPVFSQDGKSFYPQESMLSFLRKKETVDFLFGKEGVSELTGRDLFNSNMRFFENGPFGWAIRYTKNRKVFEFVYVKLYEEWVLWEINTFSPEFEMKK